MQIDAGKLDRTITLTSKTTTRDALGQPTDTWAPVATLYAQRLNLSAADVQRGAGKQTIPEGKYLVRWRADITADMRLLLDDGQTYAITAIDEPDRRKTLMLTLQGV